MSGWTYSKAGVDLKVISELHGKVLDIIRRVNEYLGVSYGGLGGYSTWVEVNKTKLILHVDGVGTKALVASKLGNYRVLGWDSVVINVNDVVCDGGRPLALVDYIAMSRPDEKAYEEVIEGIVDAALTNKLALLGGETAILPDLMYGLDVVCTVLAVKEFDVVNKAREGDVVLGLLSNGIHANGYSLVRKVLEGSVGYDVVVDGVRISDEVLKPVRNYGPLIIDAFSSKLINSAAHITGGSFKKVRRVLSNDLNIVINAPKPPKIFEIIMSLGRVSIEEMYRVFNMGVGMVVTLPEENLQDFKYLAVKHNIDFVEVGYVMRGSGKVIVKTYYGDVIEF